MRKSSNGWMQEGEYVRNSLIDSGPANGRQGVYQGRAAHRMASWSDDDREGSFGINIGFQIHLGGGRGKTTTSQ